MIERGAGEPREEQCGVGDSSISRREGSSPAEGVQGVDDQLEYDDRTDPPADIAQIVGDRVDANLPDKIGETADADGEREYLIHWQGYSKAKASWEPQSNLLSETALEMAQQYDASVGLATTAADSEPTGSDRADDANKGKGKKKKKKVTTPAPEDPVAGHDASAARALRMSRRAADREARSAEMELVD